MLLPALVRWLRRRSLEAVQASLSRVLGVLLRQTALRMVERWVPMTPKLRGLLGLLSLAKATLLTLSLVAIEVARWNS